MSAILKDNSEVASMDDVVFSNRNKSYGAYQLRKNYLKNLLFAMVIAIVVFSLPILLFSFKPHPSIIGEVLGPDVTLSEEVPKERKLEKEPLKNHFEKKKLGNAINSVIEIKDSSMVKDTSNSLVNENSTVGNPIRVASNEMLEGIVEKKAKDSIIEEEAFVVADEAASYPGGRKAMLEYISNHLEYPENAIRNDIKGRVNLYFEVDKLGKIVNARILKGIDKECDTEALRLVNSFPNWIPAKINGQSVKQKHSLQLNFTLE